MEYLLLFMGFAIVLSIVVGIHELGHYLFARKANIHCHEFSIGMGPTLICKETKTMRYSLKLIPMGGSVDIAGEEGDSIYIREGNIIGLIQNNNQVEKVVVSRNFEHSDMIIGEVVEFDLDCDKRYIEIIDEDGMQKQFILADEAFFVIDDLHLFKKSATRLRKIVKPEDKFTDKTILQRFMTIFGGPMFNFILGFLLFIVISFATGVPVDKPIVNVGGEGSAAYDAGLRSGDEIVSINGNHVDNWEDIRTYLGEYDHSDSQSIHIKYERNTIESTATVIPQVNLVNLGVVGEVSPSTNNTIWSVRSGSVADSSDLVVGDSIIEIEGVSTANWYEIATEIEKNYTKEKISLKVKDNSGEIRNVTVKPYKVLNAEDATDYIITIGQTSKFSFLGSIKAGFTGIKNVFKTVAMTVDLLINDDRVGISDLSGPVGIYDATGMFLKQGILATLWWMAFLSINIGMMNLLPIPALDGGRLIFIGIEAITRKKVKPAVEALVHGIGFMLLISLFIYITYNDILRVFIK